MAFHLGWVAILLKEDDIVIVTIHLAGHRQSIVFLRLSKELFKLFVRTTGGSVLATQFQQQEICDEENEPKSLMIPFLGVICSLFKKHMLN